MSGEIDDELCRWRRSDPYGAAVTLNDLAVDSETESGPSRVAGSCVVEAGESFEHPLVLFGCDTGPVIAYDEASDPVRLLDADTDTDGDCGDGVAFGVLQQVSDGARQVPRIAMYDGGRDLAGVDGDSAAVDDASCLAQYNIVEVDEGVLRVLAGSIRRSPAAELAVPVWVAARRRIDRTRATSTAKENGFET